MSARRLISLVASRALLYFHKLASSVTQHGHGELGDERLHNIGNVRVQRGAFVTVQVAKYPAILRTRSVHGALKLSRKVGVGGRQASRLGECQLKRLVSQLHNSKDALSRVL